MDTVLFSRLAGIILGCCGIACTSASQEATISLSVNVPPIAEALKAGANGALGVRAVAEGGGGLGTDGRVDRDWPVFARYIKPLERRETAQARQ